MSQAQNSFDDQGLNDHLEKMALRDTIMYLKEAAEARKGMSAGKPAKLFLFELTPGIYSLAFCRPDGSYHTRTIGSTVPTARVKQHIEKVEKICQLEWPDAGFICYTLDIHDCVEILKARKEIEEVKFSNN